MNLGEGKHEIIFGFTRSEFNQLNFKMLRSNGTYNLHWAVKVEDVSQETWQGWVFGFYDDALQAKRMTFDMITIDLINKKETIWMNYFKKL